MDWIGGGLRNWVVARHVHPHPSLKGMILAGGMGAWAGYITPLNSGAGPMTMYTMRRYGVPLPVAVTSTFMSFVATILFFAIAGPLALLFGAGRSLGQRGNVLGLSLYDLFRGSLTIIAGIGVLMGIVIFFPRLVRDLIHRVAESVGRRSRRVADRLERLREGIDDAHESVIAFNSPRRLAGPPLGHHPLGALARQQAARRLRRAPRPRAPRQLRRHPADPDAGHVPALLRADPGGLRASARCSPRR